MAAVNLRNVRFCGYGDLNKGSLKGLSGVKRFVCSRNPMLAEKLSEVGVSKIKADRSAAISLGRVNVAKAVKTVKNRPTDDVILDIAHAAKVHTILFYPKTINGTKTAVFVSNPLNIRSMLPIKGRSLLLSINSPFQPGLINNAIGTRKGKPNNIVSLERGLPGHAEQSHKVEDAVRLIVIDILEKNEIPIPKGKY